MQQKWLRAPCFLALGGLTTYLINLIIMRPVYLNDLKDMGMDNYFELDLDKEMMKNDLKDLGIIIDDDKF